MASRGPPESLGIESMKKMHPRRLLVVQSMLARKPKWKSWLKRAHGVALTLAGCSSTQ
jgi:hypothetical protein